FAGLHTTDDCDSVGEGETAVLKGFAYELKKAKLRIDNLVIPIHLEIGPASDYYPEKFKLGIGGYLGLNLRTIQQLKYRTNGHRSKERISNTYHTNNFV